MAAVLSIIGGTAGFLGALIAFALFSAPALSALAIWAGIGCGVVVLGLSRGLAPQGQARADHTQELA